MPKVSILMPTYRHAAFIGRALESVCAQTYSDWELVIIDDASPDSTHAVIEPFLTDTRIHYHRLARNQGTGAALNHATSLAQGDYIAYLPSDDLYYPDHLMRLIHLLDTQPDLYAAYGGLRWQYSTYGATLRGDEWIGREHEALFNPPPISTRAALNNGNLFALAQVIHRRTYQNDVRWLTRAEIVTDRLEVEFWRGLAHCGARFAYAGAITCEWVDHHDQQHKIIAAGNGGIGRYRKHYQIPRDEWLNFQPSFGPVMNERERFGRFDTPPTSPAPDSLKIVIVGSTGFNPDRLMAFEERGHQLYGLWLPHPESWDSAHTGPFGNIQTIPYEHGWVEQVRALQPDVIYAMLNWQAIPMLHHVLKADLGVPFVFHFKEGPFICHEKGTWGHLVDLLTLSDGQILINTEMCEWFEIALGRPLKNPLILDGDLPKIDWFTDDWSPKLSDQDGEIHTVCAGRQIGIDPRALADAKIHLHFYGVHFHQVAPNIVREGLESGYMHLHPAVLPKDWTRELSQYDAGWFHVFDSNNHGDLRRAHWDDLNMPARLSGYTAAGLPWILKDCRHSRTGVGSAAMQGDFGVFFQDEHDLAAQLRDRPRLRQLTENARASRLEYAFDTHVDRLLAYFRELAR